MAEKTAAAKKRHIEIMAVHGEVLDEHRSWPVDPKDPDAPYLYQFLVDDGTDFQEAVKAAAVEYLQTGTGREAWHGKNDDRMAELDGRDYEPFSPKDFWDNVPDEILKRHGLARVPEQRRVHVAWYCTDEPVAKFSDAWKGYQSAYEKEKYE